MENAAHAESLDHEVYRTPLAVRPEFEFRGTPGNYRDTYHGPGKLPDKIKVWRVQNTPKGNVVARSYGFLDSPDAEIIAVGFNHGKEYGAIGIGRQGNFLQWGYCDTPAQMTEAGRSLFINCIHYIRRFEGKLPLVRRRASDRHNALSLASIITRVTGDKKEFFTGTFPEELWDKYHADPEGLTAHYKANLELVYRDKVYRIDDELKALGIDSNRKVDTLRRLIDLLDDTQRAATAGQMLARYTDRSFKTPPQWRQWFEENKDRIFFTDVGGYKFQVAPPGYITGKARE
jgi:hypothetical protein